MTRRKARVARTNPTAAATPRLQSDRDLDYIKQNWPHIAAAAWAGYQLEGRGITVVDCLKTYPVPTGLGHAIRYIPLHTIPHDADQERRMAASYDPQTEVIVTLIQANSQDTYRLAMPRLTPPAAYAHQSEVKH